MLYFGCANSDSGHYLWRAENEHAWPLPELPKAFARNRNPYARLDGGFTPTAMDRHGKDVDPETQHEGVARVTHIEGWTVLSFWDRSVDHRNGSHSTYIELGTFDFAEMAKRAQAAFPKTWARYKFEVVEDRGQVRWAAP